VQAKIKLQWYNILLVAIKIAAHKKKGCQPLSTSLKLEIAFKGW
jgi:hypothetical protein